MFTRMLFALALSAVVVPLGLAAESEIEPTQEWTGKTSDNALKALAPKSGFVSSAKLWKKLWTAWRPSEELPKIDFAEQIVLVGIVDGPNLVMLRPTMHKDDLRFIAAGTRMAGPGFGYRLVVVNKADVKTVNGQSIGANGGGEDSIQVIVVGTLQTGIVSIGGETTGTTISAKGITWELDLGQNEKLREQANAFNNKRARVQGSLERRPGVEIADRWIISVEKLEAFANQ